MDTGPNANPEVSKTLDTDIADGKFFAAIGYISLLCFVPLFLKRDNKFAQFHGRQGLVLFILELAAMMLAVVRVVGEAVFRLAGLILMIFSLTGVVKVL